MLKQVARYGVVGLIGTAAHFLLMVAAVEIGDWDPVAAGVLGFVAALVISYALNRCWTFRTGGPVAKGFLRFTAVALFALAVNSGLLFVLVHGVQLHYLQAQIALIWVPPCLNFVLNRRWTFATPR
ncbi:GtrA family protein [Inhella gelatinilytica]|uniref:GtrA family protein n=1 Tax=Inhella gelatinilytica TaxID=2795030 RepID=A0A931NCI9_9BURK|nr:GtrA family protein [Inhella gelatinilytica]MBH9552062.1 GtrA family protein [Inhella gelatinilytica]